MCVYICMYVCMYLCFYICVYECVHVRGEKMLAFMHAPRCSQPAAVSPETHAVFTERLSFHGELLYWRASARYTEVSEMCWDEKEK